MKKTAILLMAFLLTLSLCSQVRLANIFSDNMVLQAHRPIKIWGYAPVGEKVKVIVDEQLKTAVSNEMGKWQLVFPPMDYGKGVKVKVVGEQNEIELVNVLIGDVWLCSGQSNMAMTVNGEGGQVYNYKVEESNANYPEIHSFKVIPSVSVKSGVDVDGRWEVCSPETVSNFSAVAYFFARQIHQKTGIPIGIINSSWGGTDIETWISMDSFQILPDKFKAKYNNAKEEDIGIILENNEEKRKAFESVVENDIGEKEKWYTPEFNSESWELMLQPQEWSNTALALFDGVVWLRYQFLVLDEDANQPGILSLGKVDDNDVTWINGIRIGETKGAGVDRYYQIPQGVLKKGANVIVIKVADVIRAGGLTGKEEDLYIETTGGKYSLVGEWQYKISAETKDLHYEDVTPNLYYGLLYNAMIDPLKDFAIKGVIWYQGENNAGQAYNYRTLFPALIGDWRSKWGYDFPFYWVQLAGYMGKAEIPPAADSWAELREAQTRTLSVKNTGQAIATDIGDANDIHPRNKQDVGKRLACIALHKDYGMTDIIYSGPTYKSMTLQNNRIIITFDNIASGLKVMNKYGYIEGFTIAGADQNFIWAKAYLEGKDKVVVYSDKIKTPVAVRYCWSINPDVNLFNSADLPAAPFRTDNWKISTEY